ncbi:MAG TPA: dethiobiotin synthase [Verrucomicrobiae bacterium]
MFFITGTDTGVGKTVFTALLAGYLRGRGLRVAALKPLCSGGRDDARSLHAVLGGVLTLDEINPWHFRAALAPLLAASREHRMVRLAEVRAHILAIQKKFDVTMVEGAGGLLSPLGKDFDSRDLLVALRAMPIIVAQNKLGVVNHLRLTLAALPKSTSARAKIVLMAPSKPEAATATNLQLLSQFFPKKQMFTLPRLPENFVPAQALGQPLIRKTLRVLSQF